MSFFSLAFLCFFSVLCHFMGKPHWHCCRDCFQWWVAANGQRWMKLMTVCEPCWNFLWRGPSLTPSALLNHSSVSALKHTYTFEDEKEPFTVAQRRELCLSVNITNPLYNSKQHDEPLMDGWITFWYFKMMYKTIWWSWKSTHCILILQIHNTHFSAIPPQDSKYNISCPHCFCIWNFFFIFY